MNKIILIALSLLLTANVYAADQKVSALGAVNPANADTIYVIQGGVSSKATVSNLFAAGTDLDADGVIAANAVALGTDTTGNYAATVADSGAGEVTVAGSGVETATVTLAIAAGITRDTEWDTAAEINIATTDIDFSTTNHRHEGQVLGVLGLGATTVTGNTVSGNSITPGGAYTLPPYNPTPAGTRMALWNDGAGSCSWNTVVSTGGGAGTTVHSDLTNLSYATAGHTGFAASGDYITGYSTRTIALTGVGATGTVSSSTVSSNTITTSRLYSDATIGCGSLITGNTVSFNTVNIAGFGRLPAYQSRSFVLVSPNSVMSMSIWRVPYAITMKRIDVLCQGGTNIVGGLDECDGNGLNPVAIDSDITGTLMTNVRDDGSLTNPGVDASDYLKWHTTSTSGNVSAATVTFQYLIDTGTMIP